MRGVLVIVLLAGCGRLSFDGHADGGNRDAPSNLDDGGTALCNGITRLADDFSSDSRSRLWSASYTDDTSSISIGGGTVTLNIAVSAANSYVGLVSARYFDLRGQRVFAGVVHPANAKTSGGIGVGIDKTTLAHLVIEDGDVIAVREVDGVYKQTAMMPYDPIADRYFALSERGGRLYWETSPDAVAFTALYDEPAPFDLSLVDASLFAGVSTANTNPGSAVFDDFNGGVAGASAACKVATLTDSFEATNHLWENSFADACCTDSGINGQVVLSSDGSAGFAGHRSSAGYDLRDGEVIVATKGPQQATKLYGGLTAVVDQNDYLAFEMRQTGYECNAVVGGVLQQTMAALDAGDAYLRLRESGGTLGYEVSADRTTWRVLASIPTALDVSDVMIGLEIGNNMNSAANAVAFDSVNAL